MSTFRVRHVSTSTKAKVAAIGAMVALAASACGSSSTGASASGQSGSSQPGSSQTTSTPSGSGGSSPLAGKTIDLISSGSAGSTHDLFARAVAPALAEYLHATIDVVDKPGGGQLLAWNYTYGAKPDGLTICTVDVEGVLANLWEKVPNNNVVSNKIEMLGGITGAGGAAEIMYATKNSPNIYNLLKSKSQVKELGSVGDVPGPLLFGAYNTPYKDLTSYSDAAAQLQGILRGDGNVSVKSWGGSWAAYATGNKGKAILAYTMRPTWSIDPSVPTVGTLLQKDPPPNAVEVKAVEADTSALDGGTGIFAPPGTPQNIVSALIAGVKYAVSSSTYQTDATKAKISTTYEPAADQQSKLASGSQSSTVTLMRKYVPLATGVAS